MKIVKTTFLVAIVCFFSLPLMAQTKTTGQTTKKVVGIYDKIKNFKYTTAQIESLTKTIEVRKVQFGYSGGFTSIPMPKTEKKRAALKKKYDKKGKTPFRILASVYEIKTVRDKKIKAATYKGSVDVYIINLDSKEVAFSKKIPLKKLCAS